MEIDIGVGFLIDNCYTEFADDFLSSEEGWRRREMSDDEIMKLGILFSPKTSNSKPQEFWATFRNLLYFFFDIFWTTKKKGRRNLYGPFN